MPSYPGVSRRTVVQAGLAAATGLTGRGFKASQATVKDDSSARALFTRAMGNG